MNKHPDCQNECQQAVDYGVWPERSCSPKCVWLSREETRDAIGETIARVVHRQQSLGAPLGVPPSQAPSTIPEGWKLVPIEPTVEMCLADWNVGMSDAHSETGVSACAWSAMLAAAPDFMEGFEP